MSECMASVLIGGPLQFTLAFTQIVGSNAMVCAYTQTVTQYFIQPAAVSPQCCSVM